MCQAQITHTYSPTANAGCAITPARRSIAPIERVSGRRSNPVRPTIAAAADTTGRWTLDGHTPLSRVAFALGVLTIERELLMQIDIKGRNVQVTDDIRAHAERRLNKVSRQVSDLARLEIEIFKERNP